MTNKTDHEASILKDVEEISNDLVEAFINYRECFIMARMVGLTLRQDGYGNPRIERLTIEELTIDKEGKNVPK